MVFSSVIFLCFFFPVTLLGYFCLPDKYKNAFLLVMSLIFYFYGGVQAFILLCASIIVNYVCGVAIHRFRTEFGKKISMIIGVCINIGMLFVFKYLNSVVHVSKAIFPETFGNWENIILPIGISFFTFQGMSYVIDVYRAEMQGEEIYQRKLTNLALYISMFPQLVAGPIVRYTDVSKKMDKREHNWEQTAAGLVRFTLGLAKKVLLADYLGEAATSIMVQGYGMIDAPSAWLGTICYTLQILYDFSGYSDMAIGMGMIFGFYFPENFDFPYSSRSVREFWRRWHISLSSWFRDYLYIPLGGSRKGNVYLNLAIVFLVTGAWHGAEYTFIFWGAWHGFFIIIERLLSNHITIQLKNKVALSIKNIFSWIYTMLVVMLGWILFSITDLRDTFEYVGVMFGIVRYDYVMYEISYFLSSRLIFIILIATVLCIPHKKIWVSIESRIKNADVIKYVGTILLLIVCFVKVVNAQYSPFIYFRF